MANIHYEGINQTVQCDDLDSTLLDISMDNKIPHLHECGGNGRCTTCRVRIIDGAKNLTKMTRVERSTASLRSWDPSVRLACQAYALGGDVRLQRLVWTSAEVNKLQLETVPDGEAEERAIAILFCDMRNFTKLSSNNLAFDMAHMLNRFYTFLGDPILMNNGVIYQYVGDEIVGIFGTSGGTKEKNCLDAVRAALGMQYAVNRLNNQELKDFDTEFSVGIGINFGRAFIGHLGHPKHRQFAVVGDPVNVASRIQGLTKETDCNVLISEAIRKNLPKDKVVIEKSFKHLVKGIDNPLSLHYVTDFSSMDINLELQSTLDFLMSNEESFSSRFYERLFTIAPAVRALFKNNMMMQGRLLMHMLVGIVYSLGRPEHLMMGLRALGKSHVQYGVKPEYYPFVIQALLETIEEELGDLFTPRIGEAWNQALQMVTQRMMNWDK